MLRALFVLALSINFAPGASAKEFSLKTVKVTEQIYALVGPLAGRTYENHGLNNTLGFMVTDNGVILLDSGASSKGAAIIEKAIATITSQPVKWVINTGAQDHRWLGNGYFAAKGAEIIALARTVKSQQSFAEQHIRQLSSILKDRFAGTKPFYAGRKISGNHVMLELGGVKLELIWFAGAHYPDDIVVWIPESKTVFAGDLVYMDRMLGILPDERSNPISWAKAFHSMEKLAPEHIIPGHGNPGGITKARRDTGDYLDWLLENIRPAVANMDEIATVVRKLADAQQFRHLVNYDSWHRTNINRTFTRLESEDG
jgi:glyoxylase-like metal-dependent hydrolase (beta-lactamase superfamily II)